MSERSRALRRSFYGRLAVAGFVLIFLSVVLAGVSGNSPAVFSFGPPAFLALIVGLVLWITGRGLIAALVLSVFALFLFAIGEVLGGLPALGHPESFSDFVPALLRAVGSVMAFTGSLVALRQARREPAALRGGNQAEKRLIRITAVGLVALAAWSGVGTYSRNANIDAPPGALVVETLGDEFDPDEITWEPGRQQVLIVNRDSYSHTFTVDDLDLDFYVGPRTDRLITFDVTEREGEYELYCAVSGHEDMVGTVEIKS
ncbi:MAG: cupredoxin domain-containing protein [Actinomycetota bacterium]